MSKFIIGIDATNLLSGGGRTHLIEILNHFDIHNSKIEKLIVFGRKETLDLISHRCWIEKICAESLEGGVVKRTVWQIKNLKAHLNVRNCDLLFVPGGNINTTFEPSVTMSRNLLPFEWHEMKRFGFSLTFFKSILLRYSQTFSFRKAEGVLFLNSYAETCVKKTTGTISGLTKVIPHGVNERFYSPVKTQKEITVYTKENPYRLVYVSQLEGYKHQGKVLRALCSVRLRTGWNIRVDFVGPSSKKNLKKFLKTQKKMDPFSEWAFYKGSVDYDKLHEIYKEYDGSIFASSCENMPNTLVEKMLSGLPILCSSLGPMPEILESSGFYFDPLNYKSLEKAVFSFLLDPKVRQDQASYAQSLAKHFTWEQCAKETFKFLEMIICENQKLKNCE